VTDAQPRVREKWRPTLAMVVYAVLIVVLSLPTAVVVWFRALDATPSRMGPVEISALGVALVLTLVIAAVLSRTITRPIESLILRAREIARGGRAAIVAPDHQGTRELAILSQSLLDLAGRLVDRTEYVRSFAAHVSHELKSPLTAIRGSAELLRDGGMTDEERNRFLDHLIAESERMAALLDRLRELARTEVTPGENASPLQPAIGQLQRRFPALEVRAEGALEIATPLSTEAWLIVLTHLAQNAGQHGARRLGVSAAAEADCVTVDVADDGTGISPGNRDRVFEPFFTTRRETGGTGVGLEIARRILEAHGGTIRLGSGSVGASFEITVPRTG
jgi:two-component system, OmpR family, sensor kinase